MKAVNTFAEYMADEERVSPEEREKITSEADFIRKMADAQLRRPQTVIDKAKKIV